MVSQINLLKKINKLIAILLLIGCNVYSLPFPNWNISITSTNNNIQQVNRMNIIDIVGTAEVRDSCKTYSVQVFWNRPGEAYWLCSPLVLLNQKGNNKWIIRDLILFSPFSIKGSLSLFAAIIPCNQSFSTGQAYGLRTIHERSVGCSSILSLQGKKTDLIKLPEPTPSIRIKHLGDNKDVSPGQLYNVGLEATVGGDAIIPKNCHIKIAVEPITGNTRWIMQRDPECPDGKWVSVANFGREGMDIWVKFLVYAIVTRNNIPEIEYNEDQWNNILHEDVVAISSPIMAQRIEPVPQKNRIALSIKKVSGLYVDKDSIVSVDRRCAVEGLLEGRPAQVDDRIWLFVNYQLGGDEGWRYVGRAIFREEHYWNSPPLILGEAGKRIALVAVMASDRPNSPIDDAVVVLSDPVFIRLADTRLIGLEIDTVGRQVVTQDSILKVSSNCGIKGKNEGRELDVDEKVYIVKRILGSEEQWTLHGEATMISRDTWQVAPKPIGNQFKINYEVMAVVAIGGKLAIDKHGITGFSAISPIVKLQLLNY